ncbi:phage tail tape measure protein, partial [Vulcanococcus sp.]|uniref:phage tail tape measure protein n=1 Tax=Vulcanococcus sp. TaxID=2856995 RepID=UPI003C01938C
STGTQLKTINGNGLKDVYTKAGQASTATKAAAGSTQALSTGLAKVVTSGKPIGTVATALNNTSKAAKPASTAVGSLSQQLAQAGAKAPPLNAVPTALQKIKPAADSASAAVQNTGRQLQNTSSVANGFAGAITNGFRQILQGIPTGIGISLGNALLAPLKAITDAIPAAVQEFSQLDEVLRQVLSISGTSADRFGELAGYVREVGAATAATNYQVGEVAISLARAGFSLEQINDALFAVVQGAEATGTSYADMADIVVSSLGQFGLAADQAGDAVDTLTVAANSSNQTVIDLGQALKYVGPVANTVGASLQDTALQISVLANAGIKASTAGTSLRTILTNIQIAAGGAGEEFQELSRGSGRLVSALQLIGAEMTDSNGELLKGKELIYALQDSIKGLSGGERAIIGKVLAGSEGLPTLNALVNASGTEIEKIAAKIDGRLGAAADAATNNLAGLSGAFKILDSNLSTFLGSLGEFLAGFITPIVKGITALLSAFNSLPGPIKSAAFAITALAVAIGVAQAAAALLRTELIATFAGQVIGLIKQFTAALTANTAAQTLNNIATNAGLLANTLKTALSGGLQIATKGLIAMTT